MRTTITTACIFALFGQVALSTPLTLKTTTIGATFPVQDISTSSARPDFTLSHSKVHADVASSDFPAALLFCPTSNCISCFSIDMSTPPHNECLLSGVDKIESVAINQPSDAGLDFGAFIGQSGCVDFYEIEEVNKCYNLPANATFTDFAFA